MGEIKSTLDIIMEKTKGLTMTEEERSAYQKEEVSGKVRGFLQKYLDGLIGLEKLESQILALGKDKESLAKETLTQACLELVDFEEDNSQLLSALEKIGGIDTAPVKGIIDEFVEQLKQVRDDKGGGLSEHLKKKSISGSAVIPNIKADRKWVEQVSRLRDAFRDKLLKLELRRQ